MPHKFALAALAVSAFVATSASFASDRCVSTDEAGTLKVAAFQQKLMVAALTCHEIGAYNRFVISHRPELQRSDREMLALFLRKDGAEGDAHYNAYKTKLANLSMLKSNDDSDGFCEEARSEFDDLRDRSLTEFVSSRDASFDLPFSDCGSETAETHHHHIWRRHREDESVLEQ